MNHNPQKIPRVSPYEIWYNTVELGCSNAVLPTASTEILIFRNERASGRSYPCQENFHF